LREAPSQLESLPVARKSELPAWTTFQTIIEARDQGLHTFDFNRANSPQGGDDKQSHGAIRALYFAIDFESSK
jgi:hypothetical protein